MAILTRAPAICLLPLVLAAATAICSATTNEMAELTARLARLREQSRWTEAMPVTERLAELTAEYYGYDTTNTAEALQMWGWMADNNGDLQKAERIWLEALAIDEKLFGTNTVQITRRLHMLGGVHRDRGDYEKAEPLLRRALELREKNYGPDHVETAQVVNSLGRLKFMAGDFAGAITHLSHAFQIFEKRGKYARWQLAATASALAGVYSAIGDREQTERFIRRSLEVRKQLHGWEHESIVGSLREAAASYRTEKQFEKAETALREALRIRDKLLGTNHLTRCDLLGDLGYTLLLAGDLHEAEALFEQARVLLEQAADAEHRLPSILMHLGAVYERRGDYAHARELAKCALDIRVKYLGALHHFTVSTLQVLARLESMLGNTAWALAQAERIQNGEETLLANVLSFTSERQRLDCTRYSQFLRQRYALWATIDAPEPLARAILRTKALVLDSLLEDRRAAAASADPEACELLDQIKEKQRCLADLQQTSATNQITQCMADEVESLEAALARRVTGLGRARRSLSVQVEDVRSALPADTVLLEWLRYRRYTGRGENEENYGVLILSRAEKPRWIRIGAASEIERAVKLAHHALRSPPSGQVTADCLQELYRRLWVPLLGHLPANTKNILISPDGELNFVSFAGLLKTDGQFLGEQYLFSYVACGRDLIVEPKPATAGGLSIWANPDFTILPHQASVAQLSGKPGTQCSRFSPLPWAERGAQRLRGRARDLGFTNAVLRVGAEATEPDLFQICSPKALHLATHGFVLPQVRTAPAEDDHSAEFVFNSPALPPANPMLQSGLALAGAQHTLHLRAEGKYVPAREDGIVTAAEIATLNLQGTWLVVLSACDTALGEARGGEGVLGLRRAFIQAGAQNVLLTLWPIQDQLSEKFMTDFYERLQTTPTPAKALAQVQQAWLKRLRKERGPAEACRIAGPYILNFQGSLR